MASEKQQDEQGASAVEFGLIAIPFIVLVFGMIQYGWYFYVSQTTGGAASNVIRRLQVGDCWTGTAARDLAEKQSSWITDLTVTPNTLSGAAPGTTQITLVIEADGKILGFLPMPNDGVIKKTVQAQLEDTTEGAACP